MSNTERTQELNELIAFYVRTMTISAFSKIIYKQALRYGMSEAEKQFVIKSVNERLI